MLEKTRLYSLEVPRYVIENSADVLHSVWVKCDGFTLCPSVKLCQLPHLGARGVVTACVRSTMGGYCFHRCVSAHTWGAGAPHLHPIILSQVLCPLWEGGTPVTGIRSLRRVGTSARSGQGVPSQVQMGVPWPGTDNGTPMERRGIPSSGMGYPLARDGVPLPRDGVPPPRDGTADGVLDTQWVVCLLRSRRRISCL